MPPNEKDQIHAGVVEGERSEPEALRREIAPRYARGTYS